MIRVHLPGREKTLELSKLIMDINGTIAVDGILEAGVKERIEKLKERLDIYLLSSDTYGTGADIAEDLGIELFAVEDGNASNDKRDFINSFEGHECAVIGNGFNDHLIFEEAALAIGVIGQEGASIKTLLQADIVVTSILDALDLLGSHARLISTLRD